MQKELIVSTRPPLGHSIWSLCSSLLLQEEPAIEGKATIRYRDHWGENGEQTIEVTDPTYTDLWKAADTLIERSGDDHHVFVEDFLHDEDTENTWDLVTGS